MLMDSFFIFGAFENPDFDGCPKAASIPISAILLRVLINVPPSALMLS